MNNEGISIRTEIIDRFEAIELENDIKISTTQKIILCTRGPLTNILDILYGDVKLFMLGQRFKTADEDTAELLGINEGDQFNNREAIVYKRNKPLIYALSYIPTARCSTEMIQDLKDENLPIGKIIDKNHQETLWVLKDIHIEEATPTLKELFKTNEDMLTREYTIIHDSKIIIWIKESFPISYFRENIE